MGTRFCATVEAPIHEAFKRRMVANDERSTHLIFRSMGNSARVAKNSVSDEVVRRERAGAAFDEIRDLVAGARGREGLANGNVEHGIWWASMAQGLIRDVPTVAALVEQMVAEAEVILTRRLPRLVVDAPDERSEAA